MFGIGLGSLWFRRIVKMAEAEERGQHRLRGKPTDPQRQYLG